MKQSLRENIKYSFEAPPPLHKKEFLKTLKAPRMTHFEFILSQIGYIRKWIWCVSILIFTMALLAGRYLPAYALWVVSALTPFLSLTVLSECGRSERYEMNELEMAARFSLQSIIIARLGILGLENLLFLCLLIPVSIWRQAADPIRTGLYILIPYLLTAYIGLYVVRRFRGPETIYYCGAAAVCISGLSIWLLHDTLLSVFTGSSLMWWIAITVILSAGTVKQTLQFIKETEELI